MGCKLYNISYTDFDKFNMMIDIQVSCLVSVMRRLMNYCTRSSFIQIIIRFGSVLSRNLMNFGSIGWGGFPTVNEKDSDFLFRKEGKGKNEV